uniref:Uncharacterized protein n=1 Tax=Arundo donax TaxID=35708 RepID=A0A0A9AA22_ARUDO
MYRVTLSATFALREGYKFDKVMFGGFFQVLLASFRLSNIRLNISSVISRCGDAYTM